MQQTNPFDYLKNAISFSVWRNVISNQWEIFTMEAEISYFSGGFHNKEEAVGFAAYMRRMSDMEHLEIHVQGEFNNEGIIVNDCRARGCQWNANDACILIPRDTTLPLPKEDITKETWTVENNPIPRICGRYYDNQHNEIIEVN